MYGPSNPVLFVEGLVPYLQQPVLSILRILTPLKTGSVDRRIRSIDNNYFLLAAGFCPA
jgi:hypothetical protein